MLTAQPVNDADALRAAQAAMQAGAFDDAAAFVEALLLEMPDHVEALYMAAVCARYRSRDEEAFRYIRILRDVVPEFGRSYQEEGHLRRGRGELADALSAFEMACRYNPALTKSWIARAEILEAGGRAAEAETIRAHAARLVDLPRELLAVTYHLHEGRILKAEAIARAFLRANPHHIEGMRLLADIGSRLGVHEDADFLLESAIELDPDNIQLRLDYINVLRKRQRFAEALEQATALIKRDRENPVFQSHFAIESMQAGDYDTALTAFDRILEKLPGDASTLTSRGHALKTYGRTEEAIESYRAATRAEPGQGDAWYALANLKTFSFSDADLAAMRQEMTRGTLSHAARVHLCFALGKACEDREDIDQAFANYEQGNVLKRLQTRYTSEQMDTEAAGQKTLCTRELFERRIGSGSPAPDPIFIVGLPRAGSTLIEQILASHSEVDGTLELPNILSLAHRLRGRNHITDRDRYPRVLQDISTEDLAAFGREYIENTAMHRKGAAFFTDKMPNNFRHIGLIHLILPNAKIIDARRNPMDCCWSSFKQLFAEGQEFSYSLEDIGHYYRIYVDLMAHWDRVLPDGRILRVQHEDVLDDLEGQVRRLLDHCGLGFEPACLDFHKTERAVRTASSEQVRQPINKTGLEQWRKFEAHLDPLKKALGSDLAPH